MLGKHFFRRLIMCASIAAISLCFAADPITPTPTTITPPIPSEPSTPTPSEPPTPTPTPPSTPTPTTQIPITPTEIVAPAEVPQNLTPSTTPNVVQQTASAQIWNLKDADIRAVIQTVSILTGKNFIVDPRVNGKVTLMSEKPMTPDEMYQVFLSMLQILQYSAVPSGDVIKIVPAMDANALTNQLATNANPGQGDEIVVRVVAVNRVSATELVPVLRPLMPQSGSVNAYLPSNALILAGTAANIERLVAVIHQMDSVNANQISIVHLHHASAKKVVQVIQNLQRGNAAQGNASQVTLASDDEDNSILINANAANQILTRNLIHQLDRKGAASDDTRVIILNYLSAKKFAPILAKIAAGISDTSSPTSTVKADKGGAAEPAPSSSPPSEGGGAVSVSGGKVSIQAEDNNNAIIMHGPAKMLDSLTTVIRQLDHRPKEVLVEAIIVEVDENLLNQLGVIWGVPDDSAAGIDAGSTELAKHALFPFQVNGQGVGLLPNGSLTALLYLFKSNGSTDVLATPSVAVLNNQKATIDDGKNVGLANRSYQSTTVPSSDSILAPYNTIQRQDVTLSLDVTPHISPNHMVRLSLKQQDDTIDQIASITSGSDNPTIDTSKIQTSVMVKSGDILVLGGLISNEEDKSHEKIPVLGDIPVIGNFFRYTRHSLDKKCLMVFIRPVIMSRHTGDAETNGRYAYARHQEIITQLGDKIQPVMRPLPRIEQPLPLPSPVSSVILPMPETNA